jgi:hypothetical protein
MTLLAYRAKTFSVPHTEIITLANQIISSYQRQGFPLTLRALYYQFIRRDFFPNTEKSYKRLGSIINEARLAGLVSWDGIEDRSRNIARNAQWESPASILQVLEGQYHIDMWQGQEYRPEVWVEKDALIGVVAAACRPLDVTHFACRGYVSASEEWRGGMRLRQYERNGQKPVIFYLGDHDPSGIDMTRDHEERLSMFVGAEVEVVRLALNFDQVQQYNPPPNPTKMTDSRAGGYCASFGDECWELDALEPSMIVQLITDAVVARRDERQHHLVEQKREAERANLRAAVAVATEHLGEREGVVDIEDV